MNLSKESKTQIINSIENVLIKLNKDLKEANFELIKPKNLVCKFNYVITDVNNIFTISPVKLENNKNGYILKNNTPSEVIRFNKKGAENILKAFEKDQNEQLVIVEYKKYFTQKVERLKMLIESNKKTIFMLNN